MLETKKLSQTYSIANIINEITAQKLNAEEALLVEDKAIYDKCHLNEAEIKFASKDFYIWKEENKTLHFPSLDAPWEIRRAWRELNEINIEEEIFISFEEHMHFNVTKANGFFSGVRLKSINDYRNLFNLAVNTYKEFYERTSNTIYKKYIDYLIS